MCDLPVPCECTLEKRAKARAEHIERHETLEQLAFDLYSAGQITEDERNLLYDQAAREWDDAIHISSPDDPLRSLCGQYGRNLADLPERPGGMEGCWTCLIKADALASQEGREAVPA